jgi:hypothetical protein
LVPRALSLPSSWAGSLFDSPRYVSETRPFLLFLFSISFLFILPSFSVHQTKYVS